MKKFFVSSVVIVTFVAYSIYQRVFEVQAIPIIAPKTIISTPSPTVIPGSDTVFLQQNTLTPAEKTNSPYKDGRYTGDPADAFYGNIQVQATITNGRIITIQFLQYPNDRSTSIEINRQADPILAQEAIQIQNANVDIVSGATDSSEAFIQSLQSALDKSKN